MYVLFRSTNPTESIKKAAEETLKFQFETQLLLQGLQIVQHAYTQKHILFHKQAA
jgi:hypothetical protein